MKRCLVLLLAALLLLSLAACGQNAQTSDKKLTAGGVSITLPPVFSAVNQTTGRENLVASYTNQDGTAAIYVIRERLSSLGISGDCTAKEYLQMVHDRSAADELTDVTEQDGLPYYTYVEQKEPHALLNLCVGYRFGDSCYIVQFLCYQEHYESYFRERFFEWAKTVTAE